MKSHTLFLTSVVILCGTLHAEVDLSWVDTQIAAIKPKRIGIDERFIDTLKSPVLLIEKPADVNLTASGETVIPQIDTEAPLKLFAIINQSALVNGTWLKVHDSFRDYKLKRIGSNHIVLANKDGKIELFLSEKSDSIKIQVK